MEVSCLDEVFCLPGRNLDGAVDVPGLDEGAVCAQVGTMCRSNVAGHSLGVPGLLLRVIPTVGGLSAKADPDVAEEIHLLDIGSDVPVVLSEPEGRRAPERPPSGLSCPSRTRGH